MNIRLEAIRATGAFRRTTASMGTAKHGAIFASRGEVPEEELTSVSKESPTGGHFRVTQSECYSTGPRSEGDCKTHAKGCREEHEAVSSKAQLPFARLLQAGK